MNKIILVGTSHIYQICDGETDENAIEQFQQLLFRLCSHYVVKAIAEEMNQEALTESGAFKSVAQRVTDELNLAHQFSDPLRSVRQQLVIRQEHDIRAFAFINGRTKQQIESEIKNSHAIRERYWLDQLRSLNLWPLIFICGADHTESFSALLRDSGIEVIVPFPDWEPTR